MVKFSKLGILMKFNILEFIGEKCITLFWYNNPASFCLELLKTLVPQLLISSTCIVMYLF